MSLVRRVRGVPLEDLTYVVGDQNLLPALAPPPASWGRPMKILPVGHLTVYLFDYDIASRLEPFVPADLAAPERKPT
jgi:hypothetical protein